MFTLFPEPVIVRAQDVRVHDIIVSAYVGVQDFPTDAVEFAMVDEVTDKAGEPILVLHTYRRVIYGDGAVSKGGSCPEYWPRNAAVHIWPRETVWEQYAKGGK